MTGDSASPKHRAIKKILEQAIEDTYPPNGQWKIVKMKPEQKGGGPDGEMYRFDLCVQYFHSKNGGERYEMYYEVQKNLNEIGFKEKWDNLSKWETRHCKYQLIKEDEVPDRWDDMLAYLKNKVVVPW